MKKTLLFVVCVALGLFCIGADDCNLGPTGKGCSSGDECPDGQSCDLKTNTCVSTYGNDNPGGNNGGK